MFSLKSICPNDRYAILTFHRIGDSAAEGEISQREFKTLIAALSEHFILMTLVEAQRLSVAGNLPRGVVVITFDDGYRTDLEVVVPILAQYRAAATFFISSGHLGATDMWHYRVANVAATAPLNSLSAIVKTWAFEFDQQPINGDDRKGLTQQLNAWLKYLPHHERMEKVAELSGCIDAEKLPRMMMNEDEVRQLSAAGMEVGGHTKDHPILAVLDDAQAEQQIVEDRQLLQSLFDLPISSFAYPNGRWQQDFTASSKRIVAAAGYSCAVSTDHGIATAQTDQYALPRIGWWSRSKHRSLISLLKYFWRD